MARQKNWQTFIKGHKKKQKLKPKDSIFASPQEVDGRVGVIGSGKPLTEYQPPSKHLFPKQAGTGQVQAEPSLQASST